MLLFIHLILVILVTNCYFKTSHVIVYRNTWFGTTPEESFQNISCYCLSQNRYYWMVLLSISKHLMLLFIPRISAFFSFSPPLFPLIFSIFLHFLPTNILILDRPTYHPINLLIFQAFLDFSFFFRLVKIL